MTIAVEGALRGRVQVGRPAKHNWVSNRDEIERLIQQGWGLNRLGKKFGVTDTGMKLVLKRLGLRTLGMKVEVANES